MIKASPKDTSNSQNSSPKVSILQSTQDLIFALRDLGRNEIKLVQAEFHSTLRQASRDTLFIAFGFFIAALSLFPFLAFLVIGLGILLEEQYWLSALLVSAFFALFASAFSMHYWAKLKSQDLTLPRSRNNIQNQIQQLKTHSINPQNKSNNKPNKRAS